METFSSIDNHPLHIFEPVDVQCISIRAIGGDYTCAVGELQSTANVVLSKTYPTPAQHRPRTHRPELPHSFPQTL